MTLAFAIVIGFLGLLLIVSVAYLFNAHGPLVEAERQAREAWKEFEEWQDHDQELDLREKWGDDE